MTIKVKINDFIKVCKVSVGENVSNLIGTTLIYNGEKVGFVRDTNSEKNIMYWEIYEQFECMMGLILISGCSLKIPGEDVMHEPTAN